MIPNRFLLLAATALSMLPALASAKPVGSENKAVVVVTAEASMQELTNRLEALGTLKANESVNIRPKVTGIISEVLFDDGQEVETGSLLVIIDRDIESAEQKEAAVNLAEQRREYDRLTKLVKQGAAAAARVDEQKSKLKAAEAALEAQTARLGDRTVKAPFSGVLGLRRISPGALVTPESVITTLDDVHQLKLDFTIPEVFLTAVKEGQEIEARSDAYKDQSFKGVVKAIDSRIDPITRSATIRAVVPNDEGLLRPGMLLFVDLITSQQPRLVIPENAIIPEKDNHFVFVAGAEGSAEKRQVTLGYRYPGLVEITHGLKVGERVITEGTLKIRPGATVIEAGQE